MSVRKLAEIFAEKSELQDEPGFGSMIEQMITILGGIEVALRDMTDDSAALEPGLPPEYWGVYDINREVRPSSSTGTVLLTDSSTERPALAIKSLQLLSPDFSAFQANDHFLFAFIDKSMRQLSLLGELMMARHANEGSVSTHLGLAGMELHEGRIHLTSLIQALMTGKEVVMVMRQEPVEQNLGNQLLQIARERQATTIHEIVVMDSNVIKTKKLLSKYAQRIWDSSRPLTTEEAVYYNSPAAVRALVTEQTVTFLDSHPSQHSTLENGRASLAKVQEIFAWFFDLPESTERLHNITPEARFTIGDSKPSNAIERDGRLVLLDPQFLPLNRGRAGKDALSMAPWPFVHPLQALAFMAAQPAGLALTDIYQHIEQEGRAMTERQNPGEWDNAEGWYELYFAVLTAYKMFVEVVVNIDVYLERCVRNGEDNFHLRSTVEDYPAQALALVQKAQKAYLERREPAVTDKG